MRDGVFVRIIVLAVAVVMCGHTRAVAQPAGFSLVTVTAGLDQPTAFAFKGPHILVTEKGGKVRVVRPDGSLRVKPYVTLNVSTKSERGVLGIAVDPNFATNRWVYVYYTTGPAALGYTGSPKNRVSRFTTPVGLVGTDETIILDNIPCDAGNHNGGDIHFGFDGRLYVAVGDGGQFHEDALTLDNLRGKILRVNRGGASPPDNPYSQDPDGRRCGKPTGPPPGSGPCTEIYALGLRNPFRLSLRRANSSLLVTDVGETTWEEVSTLVPGGNYGWPNVEGPCPFPTFPGCDPNTEPYPPQYEYPIHAYKHFGAGEVGRAIIGGAFAENGSNYPAPYAGAYFYGDFVAGWVHVLSMDANNSVTNQSDFSTLSAPVAFRNGPDGTIYVLSIGNGALYKYVYTP
jgi:glucose/arabinose dehydrogenase